MRTSRRAVLALAATLCLAACGGGGSSRLVTVRSPSGSGAVEFEIRNQTDVAINNLYITPTARIEAATREQREPGTPAEAELWGADLLTSALEAGGRQVIPVAEGGLYDVKCVDRDGRYQHISGLKLGAGGRFILELHDGSWRVFR